MYKYLNKHKFGIKGIEMARKGGFIVLTEFESLNKRKSKSDVNLVKGEKNPIETWTGYEININ